MSGKRARRKRQRAADFHAPGPWSDVVEAASNRDRLYFESHPDRNWYVRRRMPGEFGPRDSEAQSTHVMVTQLEPGVRSRQPINVLRRSDYPTGQVPFEHFEAFIQQSGKPVSEAIPVGDDDLEDW